MRSQKLSMVSLVLTGLAVLLGVIPCSAQESSSVTRQRTERYLEKVALTISSFQSEEDKNVDPAMRARWVSQSLRRIPQEGVDRQAVVLTLKTADFIDRATALVMRAREQIAERVGVGVISGVMMSSSDQDESSLGALLFGLNGLVGLGQMFEFDAEKKELEKAAKRLGKEWEAYLRQFNQ